MNNSDKVWIRTHVSTGQVTVHSEPPRPEGTATVKDKYFNRDGEEVTTYRTFDGTVRWVWVESVLYK